MNSYNTYDEWMDKLNRIASEEYDQFERDPDNDVYREYFEEGMSSREAFYMDVSHAI